MLAVSTLTKRSSTHFRQRSSSDLLLPLLLLDCLLRSLRQQQQEEHSHTQPSWKTAAVLHNMLETCTASTGHRHSQPLLQTLHQSSCCGARCIV